MKKKEVPELIINGKNEDISPLMEEIGKYSITPTTFKSREFTVDLNNDPFFTETYQVNQNAVQRIGINSKYKLLEQAISEYNQNHSLAPLSDKDSRRTEKIKEFATKIQPTDLEEHIINKAIATIENLQNKAVLVDIFERTSDGTISNQDSTHTVILYQNSNNVAQEDVAPHEERKDQLEYVIIDPSNAAFSSFLGNIQNHKIKVGYSDSNKIYSPQKKEIGIEKVGPHSDQWRDCIDISVKLALGFNMEKLNFNFTDDKTITSSFQQCITIHNITNNPKFNNNLMTEVIEHPVRVRQASNTKISQKSNEQLEYIDQRIKEMNKFLKINETNKKYKPSIEGLRDDIDTRMSVGYKSESYQLALKDYGQLIDSVCSKHQDNVHDYELNIIGADKPVIELIEGGIDQ